MVTIDGNPWFVANDVLNVFGHGLRAHGTILKKLDQDQRRLYPIQTSMRAIISESGLYKLAMRSDKSQAKPFQDWVTRVVLPATRKDGGSPTHLLGRCIGGTVRVGVGLIRG